MRPAKDPEHNDEPDCGAWRVCTLQVPGDGGDDDKDNGNYEDKAKDMMEIKLTMNQIVVPGEYAHFKCQLTPCESGNKTLTSQIHNFDQLITF